LRFCVRATFGGEALGAQVGEHRKWTQETVRARESMSYRAQMRICHTVPPPKKTEGKTVTKKTWR
jgi:hypothetical protein